MRWVWLVAFCLVPVAGFGKSESSRVIPAVAAKTPPVIDGQLGDGEWPAEAKAERFYDNTTGQIGDELTEAWITYDASAVYVAFYMHDSNPAGIVADQIRNGSSLDGDDQAVFRIDPFATGQGTNTSRFAVNPRGVTTESFAGGRAQKVEWRGEWQAAAKIVADGWIAEMRIPWKLLDLPPGAAARDMTVNFLRFERARNRRTMWSDRTAAERFDLEGVWRGVMPPETKFKLQPRFLSYGLGEYDNDRKKFVGDAGLDIKLKLSPQLTTVGSINPDFKNVEQQVESIGFSRSERFLGDARPFFSEGADYFKYNSEFSFGRLFYSRRIRDFDFGVKLVGRATPKTPVGLLATIGQDNELNAALGITQEFGPNTSARMYAMGHRDRSLRETVMGGRATHRMGNFLADAELSRLDGTARKATAYSYAVDFQDNLFFNSFRYLAIPGQFSPRLSLINHRDVRGVSNYFAYNKVWTGKKVRFFSGEMYMNNWKRFSGAPYQDGVDASIGVGMLDNREIFVSHETRRFQGVRDSLVGMYYSQGGENRFRGFNIFTQYGRRDGARYARMSPEIRQRVLGKLDLELSGTVEQFRGRREQWIATAGWEFDPQRSLTGRVVKTGKDVNSYLAYRNSGSRGNELFIILGDPNADRFRFRLVVKYVIPF